MKYKKEFYKAFLNDYNKTWYDKDVEELKSYYDTDNRHAQTNSREGNKGKTNER